MKLHLISVKRRYLFIDNGYLNINRYLWCNKIIINIDGLLKKFYEDNI